RVLLARNGVMLNIRDICKTKQSKYWRTQAEQGNHGWQRITVALIVDGLAAMDQNPEPEMNFSAVDRFLVQLTANDSINPKIPSSYFGKLKACSLINLAIWGTLATINAKCRSRVLSLLLAMATSDKQYGAHVILHHLSAVILLCPVDILCLPPHQKVIYQDGVMKKQVDGKHTVAHIFE
ncbi:hypothetical protein BDZ89DRAFT_1055545, partial [Hymenopellis radicata]